MQIIQPEDRTTSDFLRGRHRGRPRTPVAAALLALLVSGCGGEAPSGPVDRYGRSIGSAGESHLGLPSGKLGARLLGAQASPLFSDFEATPTGSSADAVAIGDVTGDGLADVVLTTTFYFDPTNDHQLFVFAQQADGSLGAPTRVSYLARSNRTGLVLADLDGAGPAEIVVGHADGITVVRRGPAGEFEARLFEAPRSADTVSALDVDLDGALDVVGLSWSSGATVFLGDGSGGIRAQSQLATNASGRNDQEAADLNGDGATDLVVMSAQFNAPTLSVHAQTGSGQLGPATTYQLGARDLAGGVGAGDINGDGRADLVVSRPLNSPTHLSVLLQQADGTLGSPTTIASHDVPQTVEIADLDLDGRKDVLVLHGGWQALGVYQQEASGLAPEQLVAIPYASHYSPQGLAVGDIDADGCPDVAVADSNNGLVVLRGRSCVPPTPHPELLEIRGATASSSYYPDYYGAERVLDGQRYSFWVGAFGAANRPWTLTLDLGVARVASLELDWYYLYGAADFDVELSYDGGQRYVPVAESLVAPRATSYPYIATSEIAVEPQHATHLRVRINREAFYFPAISEVRVLGWPVDGPPPGAFR